MPIKVIALDLEATLISDALSAEPRPSLYEFLDFCDERFERLALFTTVEKADAQEILNDLVEAGFGNSVQGQYGKAATLPEPSAVGAD